MFKKFLAGFILAFFYFVDTSNLPKLEFPKTSAQVLVSPVSQVNQANIQVGLKEVVMEIKESSKAGDVNGDGVVNAVDRVQNRLAERVRILTER